MLSAPCFSLHFSLIYKSPFLECHSPTFGHCSPRLCFKLRGIPIGSDLIWLHFRHFTVLSPRWPSFPLALSPETQEREMKELHQQIRTHYSVLRNN